MSVILREKGVIRTPIGVFCKVCGNDISEADSVKFISHWEGLTEHGENYKCAKCGAILSQVCLRNKEDDAYIHRQQVIAKVDKYLNSDGQKKARRMSINQLERLRGLLSEVK